MSNRSWVVDDALWAVIEPLLPKWPERSPGPRPVDDRRCLQGILFVLYTGITWQQLPLELGFGSGQTCWRLRPAAPGPARRAERGWLSAYT